MEAGGPARTCHYCGKSLLTQRALYKHVRNHEMKLLHGTKRKQCPLCLKWITNVKKHTELMHSERERFPCDECGKTFAEVRHLDRHKTLHTKSFRFNCRFCSKGYNVKCALEYHEDTVHTKVKRYICDVPSCGEAFFVKLYLRRHKQRMHPA